MLIVRDVKNVQIQKLQTLNVSQSQELRRHVGRWPDGMNPRFPSKAEPGAEGPCEAGAWFRGGGAGSGAAETDPGS